jgi:hypothetical protein
MSESISISFPKRDRPLYKLIKQTHREARKKAPGGKLRLVDHARQLLRKGLDCTCDATPVQRRRARTIHKIVEA